MNKVINYIKNNTVLLVGGSAALSAFLYSFWFGWIVSLGFIVSLFIHEMGHYLAAKAIKIPTSVPIFIPYVGALISFKKEPSSAEEEAFVGIAGPIFGTAAALISYALYFITGYVPLLNIALLGFFLNLFNLLPLTPLDGGRTVAVITPRLWLVGMLIVAAMVIYFKSILILIVGLIGLTQIKRVLFQGGIDSEYYNSRIGARIVYSIIYFGLIIFLSYMLHSNVRHIRV